MKNNKLAVIFLIPVILIQLLIPLSFIAEKEKILISGEEYKFRIDYIYAENENKLSLSYVTPYCDNISQMRYARLNIIEDGTYIISEYTKEKPDRGLYIKSASGLDFVSPLSEYIVNDKSAEKISEYYFSNIFNRPEFYATAKIYKGKAVVTGIFTKDGIPVEDMAL